LKVARRVNDEQKSPNNNKRTRHQSSRPYVTRNCKRDTVVHSTALYEKPKTWTELIFELRANPKVLRDNLSYLRKSNLVQKKEPIGFELTEAGCAVMELSLKEILDSSQDE
jgi:hypothetical protein